MTKQFYNIEEIIPLREHVAAMWSTASKPPHPITPELLVPEGYVQLLFILSGGYKRRPLSSGQGRFNVDRSVIIGIQDKVLMSQYVGELKAVGMLFDPMQFYLLFGDLGSRARNAHTPIFESGLEALIRLDRTLSKVWSIKEALQEITSFFATYSAKNTRCETWRTAKIFLHDLRNNKGHKTDRLLQKSSAPEANVFRSNFKQFTGLTPREMSDILRLASSYSEPTLNESASFLTIKNLFKDIEENEEGI